MPLVGEGADVGGIPAGVGCCTIASGTLLDIIERAAMAPGGAAE